MLRRLAKSHPDAVRIGRLVQYELSTLATDLSGRLSRQQRAKLTELRGQKDLKLNIASGRTTRAGWINVDVSKSADVRMDLRRSLPFADSSVAMIFTEHFCDHLNPNGVIQKFLSECYRVLKPGGRARFVMHDAEDLMRACLDRNKRYFEIGEQPHETMMMSVNHLFRFNDFHQFLYDYETFALLLRRAGFANVSRSQYLKSDMPGIVLDYEHPHREMLSMYIEAIK